MQVEHSVSDRSVVQAVQVGQTVGDPPDMLEEMMSWPLLGKTPEQVAQGVSDAVLVGWLPVIVIEPELVTAFVCESEPVQEGDSIHVGHNDPD